MGKKPPRFLRSSWRKGKRGIKAVFGPWLRLTKRELIKKSALYAVWTVIACLVFLMWNPSDEIGNRYLASAVFQGLVTVLGIAIPSVLIAMQISASWSRSALIQPFFGFTFIYLMVYLSLLILSLIFLGDPRIQKPHAVQVLVSGFALVFLHLFDRYDALLHRLLKMKVENQRKEGDGADE